MGDDDRVARTLKRLTLELRETRRQLDEHRAQTGDPIAIVGMGCRFPGGIETPEQLWDLLAAGGDAVSPIPSDRGWTLEELTDHPLSAEGLRGAFVVDPGHFDASFFGIGPREAEAMDPQQR